ncbi:MAG: 1,4-dihydroxy-2-naphthoate octaprenyltransferase [Bacteroidota bacterium]
MLENVKSWISAMRLRTLPLALACIFTGSALSLKYYDIFTGNAFSLSIFILACLTTISLQILSNLANDYGDGQKGTDNAQRIGPMRAVQSGSISLDDMKKGVIISAICSFIFGVCLLYVSFGWEHMLYSLFFLVVGIAAIAAAIKYTVGNNAYGYNAMGDIFVFIFFGIVGVIGTSFLYTHAFRWTFVLPAITIGGLSTGVLNLNNMRDIENDLASNKITLAIKLGLQNAKIYHILLIVLSLLSLLVFTYITHTHAPFLNSYLYVLSYPIFVIHLIKVYKISEHKDFNPLLPMLAMSTFVLSILFFISCYL